MTAAISRVAFCRVAYSRNAIFMSYLVFVEGIPFRGLLLLGTGG